MSKCNTHQEHDHTHGPNCGHIALMHDGHTDYLHDGHLHHVHGDHVDEHAIEVSTGNPEACTEGHPCDGHEAGHEHGEDCGHPAIPHGDHVDYLVNGHLHHQHSGHCDHHGKIEIIV
ncbi:MAG: hypothetical protein MJE77_28145 [Proteobacteria bacterium]|nr:hypothetical protein [Pseudomonadota bacterium]